MNKLATQLAFIALVANGVLLCAIATTVFLQTHFDDPGYCVFVLITMGTPLLSILAFSVILVSSRFDPLNSESGTGTASLQKQSKNL
jgi:hypothetical protein